MADPVLYDDNPVTGYTAPSATGTDALAIGSGAVSTGTRSLAVGTSRAAANYSVAMMIGSNSTSYGAIGGSRNFAMGELAKASLGSYALGSQAVALGQRSYAIGTRSTASGENSFALGNDSASSIAGKYAYASGYFGASGDAQGGQYILRAATTDATATVLTTNNGSAGSTNQIVVNSDTCITFSGTLVAMQNGAQDQGSWEIKGLLKNDGGTTTLVNSNIQTFADGNSWVVALTADNTNNALAITCTGEASHNIRWVANIQTSEVTYA